MLEQISKLIDLCFVFEVVRKNAPLQAENADEGENK